MKIERPGDIICPVLGGLEALGRSNLEKIAEVIGDDAAKQIMEKQLRIADLPKGQLAELKKQGLIDADGRIPGLVADAQGYVDYEQIRDAFTKDLKLSSVFGLVGTSVAPAGDHGFLYQAVRGPEVLVRHLAGNLGGMRLNLWKLPEGAAKHNYDSLIMTETGKFSEARLQEVLQHAKTLPDGTKLMTRESFHAAVNSRYPRDADKPGSATLGINLALAEPEALLAIRPQGWTEAELRDLYKDKKFPADLKNRPPATLFDLMTHQLPAALKATPRALIEDVRRILNSVGGALNFPGMHGGRAMRGADLTTGEGGLSDTVSNAGAGLGKVELTKTGGVCPFLNAHAINSVPPAEQIAATHQEAVTRQQQS
jgi:hypothetical protein